MVQKRKSCLKKSRVVSAVPGTTDVVVFCVHGCGISYTTPPQHIHKQQWHKTIRKLNAHESQRCPKNPDATRCPRKHAKVRASSTANPSILETARKAPVAKRRSAPKPKAIQKAKAQAPAVEPEDVDADRNALLGAALELEELEARLNQGEAIVADPEREPELVTGVYWTYPTEDRSLAYNIFALYDDEQRSRCNEPKWMQLQRQKFAQQMTRIVYPEFREKLWRMRDNKRSAFWESASSYEPAGGPPPLASSPETQQQLGHIEFPDLLTMRRVQWGLGQQVSVFSAADGGKRSAHIVGIGGYNGSSVLLQFYSQSGMLKQQLHDGCGVESGSRVRNCVFDHTTKISDFAVHQGQVPTQDSPLASFQCSAGSTGRKIAALPCRQASLDVEPTNELLEEAFQSLDDAPYDLFADNDHRDMDNSDARSTCSLLEDEQSLTDWTDTPQWDDVGVDLQGLDLDNHSTSTKAVRRKRPSLTFPVRRPSLTDMIDSGLDFNPLWSPAPQVPHHSRQLSDESTPLTPHHSRQLSVDSTTDVWHSPMLIAQNMNGF